MQKTEHYELNLPDGDDYYNVEDFNENAEKLDEIIFEMKQTFQGGVDACYNACVTKGSTPASHALGDVVQGILDIETGGGGDAYSMFPQEIYRRDEDFYSNMSFSDQEIVFKAHTYISNDANITIDMCFSTQYASSNTISFVLLIDNEVVDPNMGSITILPNGSDIDKYNFSYTLTTPLTLGYHVISVKSYTTSGSTDAYWFLINLYGTGFTAIIDIGGYLVNGEFKNYFTPSNFIVPTNPIVYQLVTDAGGYGCCASIEDFEDAMNAHFPSSFDSGNSFHLQGISGYWDSVIEEEDPEYIVPDIADTLVYSNGKIRYTHSASRSFPVSGYGCDVWVQEEHSLLLPIVGKFFKLFDYINIHGKLTSRTSSSEDYLHCYVSIMVLNRTNQNTVEYSDNGYQIESQAIEYLSVNDEFTISVCVDDIDNNGINFIGVYFYEVDSNSDPFTVEIDKIWGTSYRIEND